MNLLKTIPIPDPDAKQTILILPSEYTKQFTDEHSVVEYSEESATSLRLRVVDPKTPQGFRRYNLVRHRGCAQLSVPRPWLRDQGVRPGVNFVLDVHQDPAQTDSLFLSVRSEL